MSDFFKIILSMSLSGSALILILSALRPVYKDSFTKAWQYYIWVIILVRLLIPFSPEFGLADGFLKGAQPKENSTQAQITVTQAAPESPSDSVNIGSGSNIQTGNYASDKLPVIADSSTSIKHRAPFKLPGGWELAGYAWLAGAVILFSIKLIQYLRFAGLIRRTSEPVLSEELAELLKSAADGLGIKRVPGLYICNFINSPMLMGLVRPSVYLPESALYLEEESLTYVLKHELMHYKRRDLLYKWICELTICMHWFNPVSYLMGRQISRLCEISCDEAVTKDLGSKEKLIYGNMLIKAAEESTAYRRNIFATTLYENKKSLKERLTSMLKAGKKSKKAAVLSGILAAVLIITVVCIGVYSWNGKGTAKAEDNTANAASNNTGSKAAGTEYMSGSKDNGNVTGGSTSESSKTADSSVDKGSTAVNGISDSTADNGNKTGSTADTTTADSNTYSTADDAAVKTLVEDFGSKLKNVSLLAPTDSVSKAMKDNYSAYVTPKLITKWIDDPQNAPGRFTSSPWPDRIDVKGLEKGDASTYTVSGEIIEVANSGSSKTDTTAKRPITLKVENTDGKWIITDVTLGEYDKSGSLFYENTKFGFKFALPDSWNGYSTYEEDWQGWSTKPDKAGLVVEAGQTIYIRHPKWTKDDPRQDIPIMVFTKAQWDKILNGEIYVSAAPVPPSELGSNSQYVFALPPRYNYAFPTGYEEVEDIIKGNPLYPTESIGK